jgi:8-oxo-dGTP diphosphatase
MDSTERINVRCSAIIFRGDQLLLLRRERNGVVDWALPGGTPNPHESVASCARREVNEETGLHVGVDRVFTATETDRRAQPEAREPGLTPDFVAVADLASVALRPPIAVHLRALHATRGSGTGAYLGNVWRPTATAETGSGR